MNIIPNNECTIIPVSNLDKSDLLLIVEKEKVFNYYYYSKFINLYRVLLL